MRSSALVEGRERAAGRWRTALSKKRGQPHMIISLASSSLRQHDHYLAVPDPSPRFYRTSRSCTYLITALTFLKLGIHFILTVSHEAYGNATSISRLLGAEKSRKIQDVIPDQYHWPDNTTFVPNRRANASIVMLARNGDLSGVVKSVKQMEDRFNKRFHYPYTFLNEEPFTDEFKECVTPFIGWISLRSLS
jgi:hypothetical protein